MTTRKILDKGYISLVETWGSDQSIIESARMSTQKGFVGWGDPRPCSIDEASDRACERGTEGCTVRHVGDEKLLSYMYTHRHSTPFEFAGAVVEVKAPIAVFREWHRHRTQSFSEASARYTKLPNESYLPDPHDVARRAGDAAKSSNKQAQAQANKVVTVEDAMAWIQKLGELHEHAESVYNDGLEAGIPKELARLAVTVGRYSVMRAQANLRNWIHFIGLRSAPNAQQEIRMYSHALFDILQEKFPRTMGLVLNEMAASEAAYRTS